MLIFLVICICSSYNTIIAKYKLQIEIYKIILTLVLDHTRWKRNSYCKKECKKNNEPVIIFRGLYSRHQVMRATSAALGLVLCRAVTDMILRTISWFCNLTILNCYGGFSNGSECNKKQETRDNTFVRWRWVGGTAARVGETPVRSELTHPFDLRVSVKATSC